MPSPNRKRPNRRPRRSGYSERDLEKLRALEADIHAGRISETDGHSLEDHMERATLKAARTLRSRA